MERQKTRALAPRVKVWLECGGAYAFGWGICEILQAVERAGSIKEAARGLGKSYRYVWNRVKEAEHALGATLVQTQVGGAGKQRSGLTPLARRLVGAFVGYRRHMIAAGQREFDRRFGERAAK
jgi:molybdate transport system regulatory protein